MILPENVFTTISFAKVIIARWPVSLRGQKSLSRAQVGLLKAGFHWRPSRSRSRSRKSATNLVKSEIGIVSRGVITKLDGIGTEESDRFHFLLILLMTPTLMTGEN